MSCRVGSGTKDKRSTGPSSIRYCERWNLGGNLGSLLGMPSLKTEPVLVLIICRLSLEPSILFSKQRGIHLLGRFETRYDFAIFKVFNPVSDFLFFSSDAEQTKKNLMGVFR